MEPIWRIQQAFGNDTMSITQINLRDGTVNHFKDGHTSVKNAADSGKLSGWNYNIFFLLNLDFDRERR